MAQRLPRAIQAQVEAADQLMAQQGQPEQPAQTPADPQPPVEPAPVVQATPEPTTPAAPAADPAPQDWESQLRAAESRYRTLQGMFNSQVPQLQNENKALKAKLSELGEAVEKLTKRPDETPPATPPVDTSKDNDEFGRDLVEMVQRQVRAYTASITSRVDAFIAETAKRLDALEGGVKVATEKATVTAEESFYARLTQAVPDWEVVNATEEFKMWLMEIDPVYRAPRQAALDRHHQNLDVAACAAVFNAFKALKPAAPAPAPMKQVLQTQISPSGTGAAPAPTAPQKEVFTAQEVEKFYREVAQGKWRDRAKDAAAMEARINAALAEGRIR